MMPPAYQRFIAIDWTGAKGTRHKAIQVAALEADETVPRLIMPSDGKAWSRQGVADWIAAGGPGPNALIGFDFSFAPPFFDCGAYFPDTDIHAQTMPDLWQAIEACCARDPDLGCESLFADAALAGQFRRPGQSALQNYRRFRTTEAWWNAHYSPRAESFFHLIGPTQVGKASLTGMRLLHGLRPHVSVWPLDKLSKRQGVTIVELFCRVFLVWAGMGRAKVAGLDALNTALARLGCGAYEGQEPLTDHACDALISAAGMRLAAQKPAAWAPKGLTPVIARTEGWVFGTGLDSSVS